MTQIGRGDPDIASQRAEGPNASILIMKVGPRIIGHVVPGLHWTGIFAPLSLSGDYVFNGRDVGKGDVFVISSQLGCHAVGSDRDNLFCGLRTAVLTRMIAAHLGVDPDEVRLGDMRLSVGSEAARAFRNYLILILRSSHNGGTSNVTMSELMELELYETVAALIASRLPAHVSFSDTRTSNRAVVRAAMDAVARSKWPVLVSDLCAAAGVSRTQLYESFANEIDLSPAQFLRKFQLTTIRNSLSNAAAPPRSVKDELLKHGVANGGRFASDYRMLFGENPSATLAQTLQQRG